MSIVSFAWRLRKKILKRWARNAFFPSTRVGMLRLCGFNIGDEVYIADDLIIVEELAERGNITIGHRVSIAPRVTLVTSSHPNRSRISAIRTGRPRAHRHRRRCVARRRLRHSARSSHRSGCGGGRKQCGGAGRLTSARRGGAAGPNRPRAYSRWRVAMIRIEAPASLRPSERYGLEVLIDLSRLLVAQSADCEVVRLTVMDRPSAGSAAADLSAQAALERLDGEVRIGLASLRAVAEVAGGAMEQRSTATDRHGRVPSAENPLVAAGQSRRPMVSLLAMELRRAVVAVAGRRPIRILAPVARPPSVGRAVDPRSRRGGLVGAVPAAPYAGAEHERLVGSGRPSRPGGKTQH